MSHKLPSISWRPRKMCIIQSESKGLKTRGVNDVNPSPRAREDEMNCPWSNSDTQKKGWIRPFSISCSFPSLSGSGRSNSLIDSIDSNANPIQKCSHRHSKCNAQSGHFMTSQVHTQN